MYKIGKLWLLFINIDGGTKAVTSIVNNMFFIMNTFQIVINMQ